MTYDPRKIRFKKLNRQEIQDRVDEFLTENGISKKPPVNIEMILEGLGFNIIPKKVREDIEALLVPPSSRKIILVNWDKYEDDRFSRRLRFSLAHELGHYVLHKEVLDMIEYESIEDFFHFNTSFLEDQYYISETQANEFAGRLLVSREYLRLELKKVLNEYPDPEGILSNDLDQLPSLLNKIGRAFNVSKDVVKVRIEREGLWNIHIL